MAKGEDAVRRKKNKENRKKQRRRNDSASVSNRIAAIIAAKKRRQSGKRRLCQGMCFSLPTPEDPFNDGRGKSELKRKQMKNFPLKVDQKVKNLSIKQKLTRTKNTEHEVAVEPEEGKLQLSLPVTSNREEISEHFELPSKFLFLCLNSIESELRHSAFFGNEVGKRLFVDSWGVEFWKCYLAGKDVLESSGSCSTVEQIAWIASTAADDITRKEKEGLSMSAPFLLFLVPSQEKAIKVRSVCKPLQGLGIHTVSLHPGASLDHQILGLKSCEPEFLVSTPERLLELSSLKAIDISGVSILVVDGLEMLIKCGWFDTMRSIMQLISTRPHTVVFGDNSDNGPHLVQLLGRK